MATRPSAYRVLASSSFIILFGCSSSTDTNGGAGGDAGGASNVGGSGAGGVGVGSGGTAGNGAGGSATGGRPVDLCQNASSCPGGACWQRLDGVKECVSPKAAMALDSCSFAQQPCCTKDGDCTNGTAGRCWPNRNVVENFCGGAVPTGNVCRYDLCTTDADCTQKPAGANVATCLPSGALGTYFAKCAYGGCRTNADCTQHPGGVCSYGLGPTNGACSLVDVLFCAYPSDPCGNPGQNCASPGMVCAPNTDYQGRACAQGPPAYP